jgi:ATP-binding cassette subfamily C protein
MSNPSTRSDAQPDLSEPSRWAVLTGLGVRLARDIASFAGRRGVVAMVLVGLGALTEGIGLFMIIPIITVAIGPGGRGGKYAAMAQGLFDRLGLHQTISRLALLLALFAVVVAIRGLVVFGRDVTLNQLQYGFVEFTRMRVTRRLAGARWDVISRLKHARINQVMSADVQRIASATNLLQQSAISVVMLAAQCLIALVLSPALALFSFLLVAVSALTLAPTLRRAFDLGAQQSGAGMRMMDATGQFLSGLKLAISQDLQTRFVAEYQESLDALAARQVDYVRRLQRRRLALTLLTTGTTAVVVLVGFGVMKLPPAILFTVLLVLVRTSGPLNQLQQASQMIAQALPAYQSVTALEDELIAAPVDVGGAVSDRAAPSGPITFAMVSFRHPEAHDASAEALRNFNLTIEPGAFLGVTGPSGAGKTTFADLLSGLFPPDKGDIAVGGISLRHGILPAWRRRISYVSQDPFLFHDTIRRNLAWAAPGEVGEEAMWAALTLAGAEELVRRMDQGLDTVVGERGTLVSGGERQRLALARALLRQPRLLILDEATNAIDVGGEQLLLKRLIALKPRPTIVMIAHRSESLSLCDRVIMLKDGGLDMAA